MVAKGYCDADAVAFWYGAVLTPAQAILVGQLLEAAEDWIDWRTGLPYLTGPVLGERLPLDGPVCKLRQRPLVSVEAVRGSLRHQTALAPALISPAEYAIDDAATARLYIRGWQSWAYLRVDYTPDATLPPRIGEATAALLADWLADQAAGAAGASGSGPIRRKTVADLTLEYATPPATAAPPGAATLGSPRVEQLLTAWTHRVVFA